MLKIFAHARGFAVNLFHQRIEESDLEKGIKAYSQDLLIELDHELTDVFPVARDILYHFIDSSPELLRSELDSLLESAGIEKGDVEKVINFLLYYGIFGVRANEQTAQYIFDVNYDLKVLQIRAARAADKASYVMNPAFRPALGIGLSDK